MTCKSIVMSYQENCKTEGATLTRLKIARHYFADGIPQTDIARDVGCHKNTVNGIIARCKSQKDPQTLALLSGNEKIKTIDLKLFDFLRFQSRKPHGNSRMADIDTEKTIVEKQSRLHYGPKRLYKHLKRSGMNTTSFSLGKIKGVYKRLRLQGKTIRTRNGERRKLYAYGEIGAFEYLQYDTKTIADVHALPKEIYRKFKDGKLGLPKYQWTIVDAKTRARFLAWSYELTSWYGLKFLETVILWLRSHGIQGSITAREDGGTEFFSASSRKLKDWNTELAMLGATAEWTGGAKWKNNLVERTHRIDDEEFYCPRGAYMHSVSSFLVEGQRWIFYYNNRGSDGIGMDGQSPREKLYSLGVYNAGAICRFPILLLDHLFAPLSEAFPPAGTQSQNVLTHYRLDSNARCVY